MFFRAWDKGGKQMPPVIEAIIVGTSSSPFVLHSGEHMILASFSRLETARRRCCYARELLPTEHRASLAFEKPSES